MSFLRQTLQIPITNSILHYITCNAVQRRRIEETALIFGGINIKITYYNSFTLPPLFLCPKIIRLFEDVHLCQIIILKALFKYERREEVPEEGLPVKHMGS